MMIVHYPIVNVTINDDIVYTQFWTDPNKKFVIVCKNYKEKNYDGL